MITQERLIEKINSLPMSRISEVEDFVDFIASRSQDCRVNEDLTDIEKDEMITRFAAEFGGTSYDFDEDLQEAALEAIAQNGEEDR